MASLGLPAGRDLPEDIILCLLPQSGQLFQQGRDAGAKVRRCPGIVHHQIAGGFLALG